MPSGVGGAVRSQRSQSMVEFAIVAPLLLLLIFGIVDFGRVIYVYITLNQAVNEAVRVAVRDSPLLPTNADVETAAKIHAVDVTLANAPGGQMWGFDNGTCSATNPANNHAPLQVTIRYNFVPITPFIKQFASNIIIEAAAIYRTEY